MKMGSYERKMTFHMQRGSLDDSLFFCGIFGAVLFIMNSMDFFEQAFI